MEKDLLTFYKINSKEEIEELEFSKKAFHPKRVVLVLDRMNNNIWVVKGKQSSNKLAYTAGLAATKLNAKNGFKFKISTVEPNEAEEFVSKLFEQYEQYKEGKQLPGIKEEKIEKPKKKITTPKTPIPAPPIEVSEEKEEKKSTKPVKEISGFGITYVEEGKEGKTGFTMPPLPILLLSMGYDILSKELLYSIDKNNLPPREELRKKLIKTIDDILDELYY